MTITEGGEPGGIAVADTKPTVGFAAAKPSTLQRVLNRVGLLWTFFILIVIIVVFGLLNHDVFSKAAWLATADYAVEYLPLAIGQTFVMICGEIDISSGAILGFTSLAGAQLMASLTAHHASPGVASLLGFLLMLAAGGGIGFINGFIVVLFKVPSFIVTLGMMLAVGYGAVNLLNGGFSISNLPSPILKIGTTSFISGWLPLPVLITLVLGLIFGVALERTRFGLHTYMLGSSRLAARRAGLKVERHVVTCFVFSGLMAAIAGLLVTSNLTVASPLTGQNDELYAITAVVIGGASLHGGRGGIFGTFVGVAILSVLTTGLVIIGVSEFWQYVAIGAILIAAVCIDQVRTRIAE